MWHRHSCLCFGKLPRLKFSDLPSLTSTDKSVCATLARA